VNWHNSKQGCNLDNSSTSQSKPTVAYGWVFAQGIRHNSRGSHEKACLCRAQGFFMLRAVVFGEEILGPSISKGSKDKQG
jgi:hypothetical protein